MNKKVKKYIIVILVCFVGLFSCEEYYRRRIGGFAGSYPFVEYWSINASEAEIIQAVKELKAEDPSLRPPDEKNPLYRRDGETVDSNDIIEPNISDSSLDGLTRKPIDTTHYVSAQPDYWLDIDFYYSDTKEEVYTWTRPTDDTLLTIFAFVGLRNISNPMDYRLINRDFWYLANRQEINKFKKTILIRLQEKILTIRNRK